MKTKDDKIMYVFPDMILLHILTNGICILVLLLIVAQIGYHNFSYSTVYVY